MLDNPLLGPPGVAPAFSAPAPAGGAARPQDAGALVAQIRRYVVELIGEEDPEFEADLVETFVETSREALADAHAAIEAKDPEALGGAAHRLRGSAANVGLEELTALWATVDDAVRSGDVARLGGPDEPLRRALAETERTLAALAGASGA